MSRELTEISEMIDEQFEIADIELADTESDELLEAILNLFI
ncbi:MAG TPA: hypothetical protein VHE59_03335 [Mucilaginibacter sp.]|nr:hypothetical protein [Mucilaginibacter sp.]